MILEADRVDLMTCNSIKAYQSSSLDLAMFAIIYKSPGGASALRISVGTSVAFEVRFKSKKHHEVEWGWSWILGFHLCVHQPFQTVCFQFERADTTNIIHCLFVVRLFIARQSLSLG